MEDNQGYRERTKTTEVSEMKQPRTSSSRGGKRWEVNELDTEGKSSQSHRKKKAVKRKT